MRNQRSIFNHARRCALMLCAMMVIASCETPPQQQAAGIPLQGGSAPQQPSQTSTQSGQPLGEVKANTRIGPGKVPLPQVQAEVEAFVDRYVLTVAQVMDEITRDHPEFRERLHAVKLAVAGGAYTIATGPNPVVSLLDVIVQATLVRHSVEKNLARGLPEDDAQRLMNVLTRQKDEAWAIGERILTPQDMADLRVLIDAWIQANPNQVYVAGIRFSDFSRLRPGEGSTLPNNLLGLLRIDPFASIDPAVREIQEARLLAERLFYYLQRMPQLLSWQTQSLYYNLAQSQESEQLLTSIEEFTQTTKQMNDTVAQLPTRIREQLEQSETTVGSLLAQMNTSLEKTSETLAQVDRTSDNLREVSSAVAEAGRAWEGTAKVFSDVATTLSPPDDPNAPPSEPVTIHDVITALDEAQTTATELRQLLNDFNATAQGDGFALSVAEARRGGQSLIVTITICALVIITAILIAAIFYRAITRRWSSR